MNEEICWAANKEFQRNQDRLQEVGNLAKHYPYPFPEILEIYIKENKDIVKTERRLQLMTAAGLPPCPKCGAGTNTYKHPWAKVWCPKCGYVLREEGSKQWVKVEIDSAGIAQNILASPEETPLQPKLSDLRIIKYTTLEKLKHCIEDVLELDYQHLSVEYRHSGPELYEALERLKKFYEEHKNDIH